MGWQQQSVEFWSREAPEDHFRTPARLRPLADAVAALATRLDLSRVVDLGAGDGILLRHVQEAAHARQGLDLVGLDVRPARCPPGLRWVQLPPLTVPSDTAAIALPPPLLDELAQPGTLLVLVELLDEIPGTVSVATGSRWTGVSPTERDWLHRWWPTPRSPNDATGARAVVGLPRDRVWAALVAALAPGSAALAVDYGHDRSERPADGGLQRHRYGRLLEPAADGSTDPASTSASVAMDAVRAAGEARGARTVMDGTVAAAVRDLVGPSRRPSGTAAPGALLSGLLHRGQWDELVDERGFGAFRWLCQQRRPDDRAGTATTGTATTGTATTGTMTT